MSRLGFDESDVFFSHPLASKASSFCEGRRKAAGKTHKKMLRAGRVETDSR
jgi:hypothetical protein